MTLKETQDTITITAEGFTIASYGADHDELIEAAREICSDIGSALSSLGTSCTHGSVTLTIEGATATSSDDENA